MAEPNACGDGLGNIRGVLFDLDGTLLQVEMRKFIPNYLRTLAEFFDDLVDRRAFAEAMTATTFGLLRADDGRRTNEEMLLEAICRYLGIHRSVYRERLKDFFSRGMAELAPLVTPLPLARRILERCFERGLSVVIATNPVFPRPLVEARLDWGGLLDFPYQLVTSYENSRYCKPNVRYFHDVLEQVGLAPEQCVMVGNDTEHDLAAREAGITTFLVDTWMIDRQGGAFVTDFRGGHAELYEFVGQLGAAGAEN